MHTFGRMTGTERDGTALMDDIHFCRIGCAPGDGKHSIAEGGCGGEVQQLDARGIAVDALTGTGRGSVATSAVRGARCRSSRGAKPMGQVGSTGTANGCLANAAHSQSTSRCLRGREIATFGIF